MKIYFWQSRAFWKLPVVLALIFLLGHYKEASTMIFVGALMGYTLGVLDIESGKR